MGRINNLNEPARRDVRKINRLERAAPLGWSSVRRGNTVFNGNESLKVVGSAVVSGWLIVTGTLKLVGTLLMEGTALFTGAFTTRGTTRFEGDTTQNGPFHVEGATDITGDVDIEGALKILGEALLDGTLTVGSGGIIKVGEGLTLEPMGAGGGAVNFMPSGGIAAGLNSLNISPPTGGRVNVLSQLLIASAPVDATATPIGITAGGLIRRLS